MLELYRDVPEPFFWDGSTLVIQGTRKTSDWLFNLDARIFTFRALSCKSAIAVHRGFYRNSLRIERLIGRSEIKRAESLRGHSLGGATALILAIKYDLPCEAYCSPKPFLAASEPTFNQAVVVRQLSGDIVGYLPPMGFTHGKMARVEIHSSHLLQHFWV